MAKLDRNETVLALLAGTLSEQDAADEHGVSVSDVRRWKARFVEAGRGALEDAEPNREALAYRARTMPRTAARLTRSALRPEAILAAILAILAIGASGYFAWDRFATRRSDLAAQCDAGVVKRLSALSAPLTMTLYVSPLNDPLKEMASQIAALGERYSASGKLTFERVDVVDDATRQRAAEAGLHVLALSDAKDDGPVSGYCGLVFTYKSERDVITVMTPEQTRGISFWVANKIRELTAKADNTFATIALTTTPGGVSLRAPELIAPQGGRPGPTIASIVEQALPFYKLVDAAAGEQVPDEATTLLLTQPGAALDEAARQQIDAFLMRGERTLLVVASAVNVAANDATMTATLDTKGVDALLAPYGITMQRDLVIDAGSALRFPVVDDSPNARELVVPAVLLLSDDADGAPEVQRLDSDFAGFFRLDGVSFPFVSSLDIRADKQPSMTYRVVARSSKQARVVVADAIEVGPAAAPSGASAGQRVLAVAATGRLASAFGAGEASAQILVVASSQMLTNPFARAGNPLPLPPQQSVMGASGGDDGLQQLAMGYAQRHMTTTILAFKNMLDWGTADSDLLACSALLVEAAP